MASMVRLSRSRVASMRVVAPDAGAHAEM